MQASLGDNINLNGWVATRVVDGPGVDLGDGHDGWNGQLSVQGEVLSHGFYETRKKLWKSDQQEGWNIQ
jgi:hypothetical protein